MHHLSEQTGKVNGMHLLYIAPFNFSGFTLLLINPFTNTPMLAPSGITWGLVSCPRTLVDREAKRQPYSYWTTCSTT